MVEVTQTCFKNISQFPFLCCNETRMQVFLVSVDLFSPDGFSYILSVNFARVHVMSCLLIKI